ncbi:MAG: PAS domain-containing protein [Dehalococcoidia bacterium]|nr:PAS domain-containing protein [Dehalococcoidia bacterium]
MGTPLRVLIVEDSEDDARFVLRELGRGGYDLVSRRVDTPEDMDAALKEGTWDTVISDYTMPRFSAPAALKLLQGSGLDLPFIVVTGAVGEEIAVGVMKAGAHDYVMKENLGRLPSTVERELRQAELRRERKRVAEALKQSEQRLKDAQNLGKIGSWESDAATNKIEWSSETYEIYERDQALGPLSPDEEAGCYTPAGVERLREAIRMATEEGKESGFDVTATLPGGTTKYLHTWMRPVKDETGRVVKLFGTVQDITERKQAEEREKQQRVFSEALMETSPACILVVDSDGKVVFANAETDRVLGLSRDGVVGMVFGEDFRLLDISGAPVPEEQLPVSRVFLTRQPLYSTEYAFDSPTGRRIFSISAAPLFDETGSVLHGVATVEDISDIKRHAQELEQAVERLQKAMYATVEAMSATVEMRDPYTASHQRRVTVVACAIARELGAGKDSVLALTVAGRMHDLGKLKVPTEILTRPGKLSALELQMMKEHPQATYDLLKGIDFPWPVAEICLQHHERLDGSGYPQGLTGEQMLPEARILAVADVFESMSSHRPYRPALGVKAALAELQQHSGTLYDADAVDACVRLVRAKGFTLD